KLDEADKQDLDQDKAIALMQANPSMIKRPVLDTGPRRLVGFKPELYATAFCFHAPRTTHLMSDHFSLDLGIGTQNMAGDWLEVFYAQPILHPDRALVAAVGQQLGYTGGNQAIDLPVSQCAVLGKALADAGFAELGALATELQHSTRPLVVTILE